jgi:cytochrome c-type protein NapC
LTLRSVWKKLTSPTSRYPLGALLVVGALLGALGVLGFNYSMAATNTDEFCVSCHELADNALVEFQGTSHDVNRTGVSATCGDCHVPQQLFPKIWRKIRAAGEVYHHLMGTISTPEEYDEHRLWMATKTWNYMKAVDSRECRNCHNTTRWDVTAQSATARRYHTGALARGRTCIDCHKGIAHKLPRDIREDPGFRGSP